MIKKYFGMCVREATKDAPVYIEIPAVILGVIFDLMPDMPNFIAYSCYAIFFSTLIFLVPYEVYKKTAQKRDDLEKQINGILNPMPDVWVYEAMVYVVEKKWGNEINCVRDAEFISTVFRVLKDVHQKAADGYLPIWGRQYGDQSGALKKLDKSYWLSFGFDQMSFYLPEKEKCKTEPKSIGSQAGNNVWNLQTSKSVVEALWPPGNTSP